MKVFASFSGIALAALGLFAFWGEETCTRIPPRHWLSPLEIELRLRDAQFRLESVRTASNRCYEVVASDVYGMRHAMIIDPADGSIMSTERQPASAESNGSHPAPSAANQGRRPAPQVVD